MLPTTDLLPEQADLACDQLCSRGCIGSACYCDGFERAGLDALCVATPNCATICDTNPDCAGYAVEDGFCYLYSCPASVTQTHAVGGADFQFALVEAAAGAGTWFRRTYGRICTTPAEYSVTAGHVTVTTRATTGATFVVDPDHVATIEVVATQGNLSSLLGESEDRIMIVDADGTCGLSPPTAQATPVLDANAGAAGPSGQVQSQPWTQLQPISGPGISVEPDVKPAGSTASTRIARAPTWTRRPSRSCTSTSASRSAS